MVGREMSGSCAIGSNVRLAFQPARRRSLLKRSSRNRCCSIGQENVSQVSPRRAIAPNAGISRRQYLQTHGEIAKAATLLGISRTTLWEKMRRLGLH